MTVHSCALFPASSALRRACSSASRHEHSSLRTLNMAAQRFVFSSIFACAAACLRSYSELRFLRMIRLCVSNSGRDARESLLCLQIVFVVEQCSVYVTLLKCRTVAHLLQLLVLGFARKGFSSWQYAHSTWSIHLEMTCSRAVPCDPSLSCSTWSAMIKFSTSCKTKVTHTYRHSNVSRLTSMSP